MKYLPILAFLLLASCTSIFQSSEDDPIVARAEDKYLKKSEITDRIPDGLTERDSLTLAQNYINKWVQNEILITKAYKIAFEQYRYGYAAAYSMIIFAILLAYGTWQNRVSRATEPL